LAVSLANPSSPPPHPDSIRQGATAVTHIRIHLSMPARARAGRLLDLVVGDWWAPNRRVAAAVLVVVLCLVGVIALTLGVTAALVVVAVGATMRVCCRES
jgi:hypothetical protein